MGSSPGFVSNPCDIRPVQTRFRCGCGCACLNPATQMNSPAHSPKGTRSPGAVRKLRIRLPPLVSARFQVLFHSPHRGSFHLSLTVLVRYRSSSVFSLGEWSPLLPTGLACPVVLRVSSHALCGFRLRDCHPVPLAFPAPFGYPRRTLAQGPYNPARAETRTVWAVPRSLATTRGIVSFPGGTKMFQFPPFPPRSLCVQPRGAPPFPTARVSPFGHPRIKACTRLPEAFRSVPRPSSALDAKASTVRPS
jgi:hypothetical protein